jgi:NAD(P)H-hydrate epimerase
VSVRVVTGAEAAAIDGAAIAAGTPSLALMHRAGAAAADLVMRWFGDVAGTGVLIMTGPGNNGGDGWVVAGQLADRGVPVRVHEVLESRTTDASTVRSDVVHRVSLGPGDGTEVVLVDALLGTGARGALSGALADAVATIQQRRAAGAAVVALDIPTGVDATTGAADLAVTADLTISFGTVKRGHLLARAACGAIAVVDIGLGSFAGPHGALLIDEAWVANTVPPIDTNAHKGTRRRVVMVGGARGMAGALVLAIQAASRSGVGLVRALVEEPSLVPVQSGAIEATAATWPLPPADLAQLTQGCHAVLLGPGLGRSDESRRVLEMALQVWQGPTVLDADAISLFEGKTSALGAALAGREALLTPHVAELARLIGATNDEVARDRFSVAREVSRALGASILLKGVPTVITNPAGETLVSATGTPVLAAAGSGDILAGVAVTLLAQTGNAWQSGACAAWIHGRAGEIANAGRPVRGVTVTDVLDRLGDAWRLTSPAAAMPVLAEIPPVSGHRWGVVA